MTIFPPTHMSGEPQKIPGAERAGLCAHVPTLPRQVLGLANVAPRHHGIETTLEADRMARLNRLTVRMLLNGRGIHLPTGEDMRGLNRRAARRGALVLAQQVLLQRGLPGPSASEVDAAQQAAEGIHGRIRRLDLPRVALGRTMEVMLALDRACALENSGFEVKVGLFVPDAVSPRNLMLVARR